MFTATETIRVGPAGWSYKDWFGIVYPQRPVKGFKELDFLARFFDTVEINSTFYRPANSFMASAWVKKVAHNPRFKFTAKLWQRFTHDRREFGSGEVKQVLDGIDPLVEAGKLGALLCQFPWSFKNDDAGREWLVNILMTFRDYPLVIEVRHQSWDIPETYDFLNKYGVGIASIDQPVIGQSIKPMDVLTGNLGYIRMHGRNYKAWFPKKKTEQLSEDDKFARYNYLYAEEEIDEWIEKIQTIAEDARETYVVLNNHPQGQAVCNAMQIRAKLGEKKIPAPETLLSRFPQLESITEPIGNDQRELF
jgi:uncharacterized protein YecE (DUF72 family)